VEQGRAEAATWSSLAKSAVAQVRDGRRVGGSLNIKDVTLYDGWTARTGATQHAVAKAKKSSKPSQLLDLTVIVGQSETR
jgi:hypothetical protein